MRNINIKYYYYLLLLYKALLSYRNTTLAKVNLSPSQMLMGRRFRTLTPLTKDMLKRQLYDPEVVLLKLKEKQRKQKLQHDKTAKELPPLRDGKVERVREGNKWKPASITQVLPSARLARLKQSVESTEETVAIYQELKTSDTKLSHPLLQWPTRILEHCQLKCLWLLPRGLVGQFENCRDLRTM